MEGIDPAYQGDAQSRRCALHAAAERGFLEVCYLLVEVRTAVEATSVSFGEASLRYVQGLDHGRVEH